MWSASSPLSGLLPSLALRAILVPVLLISLVFCCCRSSSLFLLFNFLLVLVLVSSCSCSFSFSCCCCVMAVLWLRAERCSAPLPFFRSIQHEQSALWYKSVQRCANGACSMPSLSSSSPPSLHVSLPPLPPPPSPLSHPSLPVSAAPFPPGAFSRPVSLAVGQHGLPRPQRGSEPVLLLHAAVAEPNGQGDGTEFSQRPSRAALSFLPPAPRRAGRLRPKP